MGAPIYDYVVLLPGGDVNFYRYGSSRRDHQGARDVAYSNTRLVLVCAYRDGSPAVTLLASAADDRRHPPRPTHQLARLLHGYDGLTVTDPPVGPAAITERSAPPTGNACGMHVSLAPRLITERPVPASR